MSPKWCGYAAVPGPFAECTSKMSTDDVEAFVEACAYDLCVHYGKEDKMKEFMCTSAATLQSMCYMAFKTEIQKINFRNDTYCPSKQQKLVEADVLNSIKMSD